MKYVKASNLLDRKNQAGYYDRERNIIVVDFSQGTPQAILTSGHEFLHKVFDVLSVEDWVDLLDPLFNLSVMKKTRLWVQVFKAVFFTEHQHYYPIEDEQRVKG